MVQPFSTWRSGSSSFDASMERVSGWYKRTVQKIILVIALVVVSWANADTLSIVNHLWHDSAQRAALVKAAQDLAARQSSGQTASSAGATSSPPDLQGVDTTALDDLLGWSNFKQPAPPGDWALKVLGLLLTAAAASLGAPFWFDVLNKFINIRGAGKSPEEKPRPPDTKPQPEARTGPGPGGWAAAGADGVGLTAPVVQSISPGQPIASPGPQTEEEGFSDAANAS